MRIHYIFPLSPGMEVRGRAPLWPPDQWVLSHSLTLARSTFGSSKSLWKLASKSRTLRAASSTSASSSPRWNLGHPAAIGDDELAGTDSQAGHGDRRVDAHQGEDAVAGHLPRGPDGHADSPDALQVSYGAIHKHPGYAQHLMSGGHSVTKGRGASGTRVHVLVDGHDGARRLVQHVLVLSPRYRGRVGVHGRDLAGYGVAHGAAQLRKEALHLRARIALGLPPAPLKLTASLGTLPAPRPRR